MGYLTLLMLRDQIAQNKGIIEKAKKYLKPGQKPPAEVKVHRGARGGTYYNTEDVHAARGTTPQKRLPAFRKQEDGTLRHRTKTGEHGPGAYHITEKDGEHHLSFIPHGEGEALELGSHADLKELKRMVDKFKGGEKKEELLSITPDNLQTQHLIDPVNGGTIKSYVDADGTHYSHTRNTRDLNIVRDWQKNGGKVYRKEATKKTLTGENYPSDEYLYSLLKQNPETKEKLASGELHPFDMKKYLAESESVGEYKARMDGNLKSLLNTPSEAEHEVIDVEPKVVEPEDSRVKEVHDDMDEIQANIYYHRLDQAGYKNINAVLVGKNKYEFKFSPPSRPTINDLDPITAKTTPEGVDYFDTGGNQYNYSGTTSESLDDALKHQSNGGKIHPFRSDLTGRTNYKFLDKVEPVSNPMVELADKKQVIPIKEQGEEPKGVEKAPSNADLKSEVQSSKTAIGSLMGRDTFMDLLRAIDPKERMRKEKREELLKKHDFLKKHLGDKNPEAIQLVREDVNKMIGSLQTDIDTASGRGLKLNDINKLYSKQNDLKNLIQYLDTHVLSQKKEEKPSPQPEPESNPLLTLSGDKRHDPDQRKIATNLGKTEAKPLSRSQEPAKEFGVDNRQIYEEKEDTKSRQDTLNQNRLDTENKKKDPNPVRDFSPVRSFFLNHPAVSSLPDHEKTGITRALDDAETVYQTTNSLPGFQRALKSFDTGGEDRYNQTIRTLMVTPKEVFGEKSGKGKAVGVKSTRTGSSRVMSPALQKKRIHTDMVNAGLDPETHDLDSLLDSTLSLRENRDNVAKQLGYEYTKRQKKEAKEQADHHQCISAQERCEVGGDPDACHQYRSNGCEKIYGPVSIAEKDQKKPVSRKKETIPRVMISGNTFTHKDTIREMGGKYNKARKAWTYEPKSTEDRDAFISEMKSRGLTIGDYSDDMKKEDGTARYEEIRRGMGRLMSSGMSGL